VTAPSQPRRRLAQPAFRQGTLVGVGLIGGSLALALREAGTVGRVVGVERAECLDETRAAGVVDAVFPAEEIAQALSGSDLVVLAAPIGPLLETLGGIGPHLAPGALVTDVGSTKERVCRAAEGLPESVHFVGGHPMAGSERRGVSCADPLLFQDAAWALCPTTRRVPDALLARLRALIRSLGAHPIELEPVRHDRLAAAVSHVPYLVAAAMSNAVGRLGEVDPLAPRLAAGGFRDVTRTASSPYALWRDILATNVGAIGHQLAAFRRSLDRLEQALGSDEALRSELTEAARHRLNVPHDLPGVHHPEAELIVRVLDEPGALAAVTTALARERINVRDIQVLKVRQDEDGVLRLAFVDRAETQRAAEILRQAGHDVRLRSEPRG